MNQAIVNFNVQRPGVLNAAVAVRSVGSEPASDF
jgi:hypothetical protein